MRILIFLIVQTVLVTTVSAQIIENITGEVYEITVEKVFVRKAPGNYSKNQGVLQKGERVIMLKDGKKWPEVKLSNGKIGYVFRRCMKKIESSPEVQSQPAKPEPLPRSNVQLPTSPSPTTYPITKELGATSSETDFKKLQDELAAKDAEIIQLKQYISQLVKTNEATADRKKVALQQAYGSKLLLALVEEKGEKVYLRGVGEALVYSHEGISVLRIPQNLKQRADATMAFIHPEEITLNNFIYYIVPSTAFSR